MEQYTFSYNKTTKSQLPETIQKLITAAEEATKDAYAPYSHFKVGAAVLLADGSIRTGANHENASYPAGICAERSVLATINPDNGSQHIEAIAVTYKADEHLMMPLSPCGICRQSMLEQQVAQHKKYAVYMCSPDGQVIYVDDVTLLLPFFFSNENLGM